MTLITAATETNPLATDYLPFGRVGGTTARYMEAGALTGLTGYGFLDAATLAGATSATLKGVPAWLSAYSAWVVIDPFTIECEVRRVTAVSTNTVTIAALTYAHAANDTVFILATPTLNLKWFGAKGDGVTDDLVALNRAAAQLTPGGAIYGPAGTYRWRPAATNPRGINLSGKTGFTFYGDGDATVFELDPTYPWDTSQPDAHLFYCVGTSQAAFRNFKIDGRWATIQGINPTLNEQMHGFFLSGVELAGQAAGPVEDITFENITYYNIRGDGMYFIGDDTYTPDNIKADKCLFDSCGRSGAAHQSVRNLTYSNCHFRNINDQDLDFEITSARPLEYITIDNCRFDHTTSAASVALTGFDNDNLMRHVRFTNNYLSNGALYLRYVDDVLISGNTIIGRDDGDNPAVTLALGCYNVHMENNPYIEGNLAGEPVIKADVNVGGGHTFYFRGNTVKQNVAATAVYIQNFTHSVFVNENDVTGTGGAGAGVQVGSFLANMGVNRGLSVEGNKIKNCGSSGAIFLVCSQNLTSSWQAVSIRRNEMFDDQDTPTQTTGIYLDSSTNADFMADNTLVIAGNIYGTGVTTRINNNANVTAWAIDGNPPDVATYQMGVNGVPAFTAVNGSKAIRKDSGTGTTFYGRENGVWVVK